MKGHHILTLSLLFLSSVFTACDDLEKQVDRSVNDLNASINKIDANAANMVNVLNGIKKDYRDDVKDIISNDIDKLVKTTIYSTGTEFRCNVDFVRTRIRNGLSNTIIKLKNLVRLKNKEKPWPLSPFAPTFCNCSPTVVDLNQSSNQRIEIYGYDFEYSDKLSVFALTADGKRTDVANRLVKSTDYMLVLGTDKISSIKNCDRVEVYFAKKNIYNFLVIPKSPKICIERDHSFSPSPNTYEISAESCQGSKDGEFAGAVFMECTGQLAVSADNKSIICNIHFKADEKDGDTHACYDRSFTVFTAETGYKIKDILTPKSFEYKYINNHEQEDILSGNGFASKAHLRGDHQGNDIGEWTGGSLWFNNIRVTLVEEGECVLKENYITYNMGTSIGAVTAQVSAISRNQISILKSLNH